MSRLRLVLAVDSLDMGGAERHVAGLATALVANGHDVFLACSAGGYLAATAEAGGVVVCSLGPVPVKRRVSVAYGLRLRRLVSVSRPHLVHAHMHASAAAARLATLGTAVPLVVTEHSEAAWRTHSALWAARNVYRHSAAIIAVSAAIRHRLIGTDGVAPERITVIPNCPVPSSLPTGPEPVALGLPGGPLVGVVARLRPEKGVNFFVDAAAHVAREVPDARFVVVGDGPEREHLKRVAGEYGIGDCMRFLGFRPDAPGIIAGLDMLVVPSLSEGTPLVVLEAITAGVPVVASATGGIPEQVRDDVEAVLVPPGDAVALANGILGLLRDPARRARLAVAARQRASSEFNPEVFLEATQAVYESALDGASVSATGR
jgi:glycosyltransferase involved in cell wall biosynthesis